MVRVDAKWVFNAAGGLFALIAAGVAIADQNGSWPMALLSVAFLIFGNIEKFDSLKAGPGGFEATTRQALQEARGADH